MGYNLADYEPVLPAEAMQALFKCSNGNVVMQTRAGRKGWERSLFCEDCNKRQSVETLVLLEKDEERAFARILEFCAEHRHDAHFKAANREQSAVVKTDAGRRIKEV